MLSEEFIKAYPFRAGDANWFKPFCLADYAVIHFTKLMEAYNAEEVDF